MPATIRTITPPALEPVTLEEAKKHLRVDSDDEDDDIAGWIKTARELLEKEAGVSLLTQTHELQIDAFPADEIWLYRPPLVSVGSIAYLDSNDDPQTLDPATYRVLPGFPGRVARKSGKCWPSVCPRAGAVSIVFTAGYGDDAEAVPSRAKSAIKLLVGSYFENREEGQAVKTNQLARGFAALGESLAGRRGF